MYLFNTTILAPSALLAQWQFAANSALNRGLLALLILAAGAATVYLYRAQQRIASRRLIVALTCIRVGLIVLMLFMLLGLSVRWTHAGTSGGTLWLVLDDSGSMAQTDAQSTPTERLRWADALGLLPAPDTRPSKLDRFMARLHCLRDDLNYQKNRGELPAADENAAKTQAAALVRSVEEWNAKLTTLAAQLAKDPQATAPDLAARKSIETAGTLVRNGLAQAAKRSAPEQAAGDVPWQAVGQNLDTAAAALAPLADAADAAFLAAHGAEPAVADAMKQVAQKSRAQLAAADLIVRTKLGDKSLADLYPLQNTKLVTFSDRPQVVAARDAGELIKAIETAAAPAGRCTNIASALQFINEQVGQDEPASVVLLGDGRQNAGGDLVEPARLLAARNIRVFTVSLGSRQVAPDAAVEAIDAPEWVYKDDTLTASALLRMDGLAGKPVKIEFRRGSTLLDTQTVTPAQSAAARRLTFHDKPPAPGLYEYEVKVTDAPGETVKENNRRTLRISVKSQPLHVLVIEDQPRWEYRYLVNYLSRDNRVKLQTVLLQPARVEMVARPKPVKASPDNPSTEAQLMPSGDREWAAFDLIVLGDVPREALPPETQQALAKAVKERGATLLVIAGPFNMPGHFTDTPLSELLPVELASPWTPDALQLHLKEGFIPAAAPEGSASMMSQFSSDENASAQLWANLPPWYWHSEQTQAKPSASVLWSLAETARPGEAAPTADGSLESVRQRALLCTASVGLGRVMYLASDSTWRLRQVLGENLHERFWGQVIRWVAGSDLPAGGKFVRFGTNKPSYVAGEPVLVTARLLGSDLAPLTRQQVKVLARALPEKDPATGAVKGEGKIIGEAALAESGEAPGYYRAALQGLPTGGVELSLRGEAVEKLLADDSTAAQKTLAIDVQSQLDIEQQNINADPATLVRVAQAGGGIAVDGPYADLLAGQIPQLDYKIEKVEQIGLFADPKNIHTKIVHWGFLGVFVTLITAEWVIRKRGGLV